jgi:chromate transporter
MHRELVEKRRWISDERFLYALNYCMLLPGPEATQLATYVGFLLHKTRGGIVAGVLFVLPGFLALLGLSALYASFGQLPIVVGLFFGLKAAVLALVLEAVQRIGKRALTSRFLVSIAVFAFAALFLLKLPFPLLVLGAALVGAVGQRYVPGAFPGLKPQTTRAEDPTETLLDSMAAKGELEHAKPSFGRSLRVLIVCGTLWALPVAIVRAWLGGSSVYLAQAVFFSKAAVVTFGGAYAVLAYVAQQAVEVFGWLRPGEMVDGLGLAETTPGPLIMVLEFVGFLGAYRQPGSLHPLLSGTVGACVTVWVTFVPCFLWIFLGAPYIEALRHQRALRAALSAITAAVVGVIVNLSLWFGLHVVFRHVTERRLGPLHLLVPELASVDPAALALSILAMLALFRWKLGLGKTLAASAALGFLWQLVSG